MLRFDRVGLFLCAALTLMPGGAGAFDDANYPDLKGQWNSQEVPGIGPSFDPTRRPGLAQQAEQTQAAPRQRSQFEQQTHVHDVALDRLDLRQRQEEQGPIAQRTQIDLVEESIEQVRPGANALGNGFESRFHARPVVAADDDDNVVVVTELGEVLLPPFLIVLVGAEEVVARREHRLALGRA